MTFSKLYSSLLNILCGLEGVQAVGKSGGEKLPEQNDSDVDIFVFCSEIPDAQVRRGAIDKLEISGDGIKTSEIKGEFWGVCDYVLLDGIETCLMYFTVSDMNSEIDAILNGLRLDREGEYFYPTGRCATFLSLHTIYDKNDYIAEIKEKVSVYPLALAKALYNHHITRINDSEDFERAVARGDVLFYHSTMDLAIDHFLQALFALNRCFFPSRKRSAAYIDSFQLKHMNCSLRLLEVVEMGAKAETLMKSYNNWCMLCKELYLIGALQNEIRRT